MSPTVQGRASMGSQKWLQDLVNLYPNLINRILIDRLGLPLDTHVKWVSPLAEDDFKEYHDTGFLEKLDLANLKEPLINNFWPDNGPHWDALAKIDNIKILVEAKSYTGEILSDPCGASSDASKSLIRNSLQRVKEFMGCNNAVDWANCFYQYANRLAHLYFLRELNQVNAYLIFIYFLNDKEKGGPTTESEWHSAIKRVEKCLGISRNHGLINYILDIFIDVNDLV